MRRIGTVFVLLALLDWISLDPAFGFSYVMAGKRLAPDAIVHPAGYDGSGGPLQMTVALHPEFANLEEKVEFSLVEAVSIWNSLLVATESLGPSVEIADPKGVDFFGTVIHEIGHTLGLAHPAAGRTPGLRRVRGKFAASTPGPDGKENFDPGPDGIAGTHDDERGDDVNLHYFKRADNNPFTLPAEGIFDSTTYSREPEDLPAGSTSAVVGDRAIAATEEYGLENTETLMMTGGSLRSGRVRRALGADDVAGIRFAMSGIDEIQGTRDDYRIELEYIGVDDEADILIRFDGESPFAAAGIATERIEGNHYAMQPGRVIGYNPTPPNQRAWMAPVPRLIEDARIAGINQRAVSVDIPTEEGKRYGIRWPRPASESGESGIIVQIGEERIAPVSATLLLFVAASDESNVKVAFPESHPDTGAFEIFELEGRELF